MNRWLLLLIGIVAILLLSQCSYRMAGVRPLGEPIRITITKNATSAVRAQAYLQKEIGDAIENKLGWEVSPSGSARLQITIDKEDIFASGNDTRGIATRWNINLHGQVLITSRYGNAVSNWSATAYSSGLNNEAAALESAAIIAGEQISTWLEVWIEQQPQSNQPDTSQ